MHKQDPNNASPYSIFSLVLQILSLSSCLWTVVEEVLWSSRNKKKTVRMSKFESNYQISSGLKCTIFAMQPILINRSMLFVTIVECVAILCHVYSVKFQKESTVCQSKERQHWTNTCFYFQWSTSLESSVHAKLWGTFWNPAAPV